MAVKTNKYNKASWTLSRLLSEREVIETNARVHAIATARDFFKRALGDCEAAIAARFEAGGEDCEHYFSRTKQEQVEALTVETVLSVADYKDDFTACQNDVETAKANVVKEVKDEMGLNTRVLAIRFLEFDSNNPSHAGAYFLALLVEVF